MKMPEWVKPALFGAVIGGGALAIVGFSFGGWMTGGAAAQMASGQAGLEVVAALAPICVVQFEQDPQSAETLDELKAARSYQRADILMKAGWATMPGSTDPNRKVAAACAKQLAAKF